MKELGITNAMANVESFYSNMYKHSKSDSPEQSRSSLLAKSKKHIFTLKPEQSMLDLGAGGQIFERQFMQAHGVPKCQIVTVDIANIQAKKLLAKNTRNITHTRADGSKLPFKDGSFSLAVSNMAIDFMQNEAFTELYRVLQPGSHAIMSLHHPFLLPDNIEESISNPKISKSERKILTFWQYLKEEDVLFKSLDDIKIAFFKVGFQIEEAKQATDNIDKWWEVDLLKPHL